MAAYLLVTVLSSRKISVRLNPFLINESIRLFNYSITFDAVAVLEIMQKTFFLLLIIIGASIAFVGYCALLIDWIQDYSNGVYGHNRLEAVLESGALLLYTYFGIKFFNRHLGSLH